MDQSIYNLSDSVQLNALPTLSINSAASALKKWFSDRSDHQVASVETQCDVLVDLQKEEGVSAARLNELIQCNTFFEYEDRMVAVKYSTDGDVISGYAHNLSIVVAASGETFPLLVDWRDETYYYRINGKFETMRELVDALTDTIDVVVTESEALMDFNQSLLNEVQEPTPDFNSIIAAGLNSQYLSVRTEAAALAKIPAKCKELAIIAYIQDWFAKCHKVTDEAYDEDPNAGSFSLGDYKASLTSSLIAGAWNVITMAAGAIGTILAVVGKGLLGAAGIALYGVSQAVSYFVNSAQQNERMTVGSGKNYEYANGQMALIGMFNATQQSVFAQNKRFSDARGTFMTTSNQDFNPNRFEYPVSSIWYPSALAYFVSEDRYMSSLLTARYRASLEEPYYIRTNKYVRLTNPSDTDVLSLIASNFSQKTKTAAMSVARMRIRTEMSESSEAAVSDLADNVFLNQFLPQVSDTLINHLSDDNTSMGPMSELMAISGTVQNIMLRAWDMALEAVTRATYRLDGNLNRFNNTDANTVESFYQKACDRIVGLGSESCGFPASQSDNKMRYALANLFTSFITGKAILRPWGDTELYENWSWQDVNDTLSQLVVFDVSTMAKFHNTFLDMWTHRSDYGKFINVVLTLIYVYISDFVQNTTYQTDLLANIQMQDVLFAWIRYQDLTYVGQVGVEDTHFIPNPWISITEDPSLVTDPLITPPKWAAGSTAAALIGLAVVAAAATFAAIKVSKAMHKHVVKRVVEKEKNAKQSLDRLEKIDPKTNPDAYKAAFKDYYKAQRKFQRYAQRVGYASNNVGSFGNITSPSAEGLLEKLPDVLNSANAVAADQLYTSGIDATGTASNIDTYMPGFSEAFEIIEKLIH